jgi:UDPglucose--hexose-1-phosphate uridylyltransferase
VEGDLDPRGLGLFDRLRGVGAHELVIDSDRHDGHLENLSPEELARWLATLADRVADLFRDRRLMYAMIFKNHGWLAGARLGHPHSQILGLPVVPAQVAAELDQASDHFARKGRCLFCDLAQEELQRQERLVCQNEGCVAFTPYASRYPFEIMVIPRQHQAELNRAGPESLAAVARIVREVCRRLGRSLEQPAFNLVIRTAPNLEAFDRRPGQWGTVRQDYHWHVEILPRLSPAGGPEVGGDLFINPTPPEEAARWLRQAE